MGKLSRDNAAFYTHTKTGFTWALCNDNQQRSEVGEYDCNCQSIGCMEIADTKSSTDFDTDRGVLGALKYYFEELPDGELPDLPESPLSTHSINVDRFELTIGLDPQRPLSKR